MSQDDNVIGIFMGLESSSNEYTAWLIAPYRPDFAIEIGSLLLIQKISDNIVTRVMDYTPRGEFTSSMGEKWLNEIASQGAIDAVGQDIKKSKVSYKVRVKVLGSLSKDGFVPGLRRIPQITSKVRHPDRQELKCIIERAMTEQESGVHIGDYDLDDSIGISFDQSELNSKRTFIFARAGYGKSNLMKVICSEWKPENGGLLVFDQEGEYAITDRKKRPGIMDKRGAILATNQVMPPGLQNVYPRIKLNLTELPHQLIIPILVDPSKDSKMFFGKLMAMDNSSWPKLVKLLKDKGWGADHDEIKKIVLGIDQDQISNRGEDVEMKAIVSNLVPPIRTLHDEKSNLIRIIKNALIEGHVFILDISRLDSRTAKFTSSLIVEHIFNENRENFIKYGGNALIKATFVLEEAHNVLSGSQHAPSTFTELAKEGRKYSLGGIFITQQPGSIPPEIVSQGDNFFVFHLLSKTDLNSLSKANAHYSDDIITQILSEPIRGKSYMWTSHQPFVIPVKVVNFEGEDMTKPDQSTDVQARHPILDEIKKQILDDDNDPTLASIRTKFLEVERMEIEKRRKTTTLYNRLDDKEKEYLTSRNYIQEYDGTPFAVTFAFYEKMQEEVPLQ